MASVKLGSWKLSELVKDPRSKEFEKFLGSIERKVQEFEGKRDLLKPIISAPDLESMIKLLEEIYEKVSIALGYAHLQYAANTSSSEASALVTGMEKMASDVANRLLFFDLWFKKEIEDEQANHLIDSVPAVYREYLRHKRRVARYALSEEEEKVINTLSVSGSKALVKIYDMITNAFEFTMRVRKDGKTTEKRFDNKEKMLSYIRSTKPEEREAAYKSLWEVYRKNATVLGEIYQNLVLRWQDEGISMRKYKSPISVRNVINNVEDETVEALLAVCKRNAHVFQEYFKEKAKIIGVKKLRRYDLYAPITSKESAQKKFTYSKAVDIVLKTFNDFDPKFKRFAERLFDEQHVDSAIRKGKRSGAFCYTVTPKITPYVLINFNGRMKDVSTLAHEFGHAIHSIAASDKPILVSHAPLPLAETASVFAEMLLNDRLADMMSKDERRIFLAEEIDELYATIMRQAFFTLFEIEAHDAIGEKNVTTDKISEIWLNNLKEQYGQAVNVSPDFAYEWLYIPHFYHTPFYCYAYSFGNLLVLSLYQQYKQEGKTFVPKYFNILAAGGSKKPEELLKENDIDITSERFWQNGFDFVREKVQQLKEY